MRAKVKKLLLATFQPEFEARYPQFSLMKLPPRSGVKIWEWPAAENLTFFVLLQAFSNEEVFVLEIAWNENREFPWSTCDIEPTDAPSTRVRLSRLWAPHGNEQVWDAAPEILAASRARLEAHARGETVTYDEDPDVAIVLPRIPPLVDDALAKFTQYAWPLFKQVAQHRGIAESAFDEEPKPTQADRELPATKKSEARKPVKKAKRGGQK